MADDNLIDPETGINWKTKKYIAAFVWFMSIIEVIYAGYEALFVIVGIILAWFWFAPYLAKYAKRHGRDSTWAFICALLFGIIGIIIYWIWDSLANKPAPPPPVPVNIVPEKTETK